MLKPEIDLIQTRGLKKGFSEEVKITPNKLGGKAGKECERWERNKLGGGRIDKRLL